MGVPANLGVIAKRGQVSQNGDHYSVFVEVLNPKNAGRGLVLGYGMTETEATENAEAEVESLREIHPMLTIVAYHN